MNYKIPKLKHFATMELDNGFVLYSKSNPTGEFCKTDAELLAKILDVDIPKLDEVAA